MKRIRYRNKLAYTPISRACFLTKISRACERGFTLIELLVAISIIGLLVTAGFAYYQDFNRRQIVNQGAKELKNNLRLTQSKALAGEKPEGWCDDSDESLIGYRLEFTSTTSYHVVAVCSNVNEGPFETILVDLPKQVDGPDGSGVLFRVLTRGAEAKTDFILSGYGIEKKVIVEESGNINIE